MFCTCKLTTKMDTRPRYVYTSLIATHQARLRCLLHEIMIGNTDFTDNLDEFPYDSDGEYDNIPESFSINSEDTYRPLVGMNIENDDTNKNADKISDTLKTLGYVGGGNMISRIGKKTQSEYDKVRTNEKMGRFMNAALLKMVVNESTISINMEYSGEVDPKEKKGDKYVYYINPNDDFTFSDRVRQGDFLTIPFQPIVIPNLIFRTEKNDTDYVFYLIRHGQGEHNVLKGFSKMNAPIDANLTDEGVAQAVRSGENFVKKRRGPNSALLLDYLFGSDLRRTRDTIAAFLQPFPVNIGTLNHSDSIYVLPCAHELSYNVKNGSCDGNQGITPNENKSSCTSKTCTTTTPFYENKNQQDVSEMLNTRPLNWEYYEKFYKGTRNKRGPGSQQCRNTNMIQQAITIIESLERSSDANVKGVLQIGGKKRKTRRKRTNRKKKSLRRSRKSRRKSKRRTYKR